MKFEGRKLGDVYKDNEVDITDAVAVLRYTLERDANIPENQRWIETTDLWKDYRRVYGEAYEDGAIDITDAVAVLRYTLERDANIPGNQRWVETTDLWG